MNLSDIYRVRDNIFSWFVDDWKVEEIMLDILILRRPGHHLQMHAYAKSKVTQINDMCICCLMGDLKESDWYTNGLQSDCGIC